jgi:very-short-patch-repair endonuclease
MIPYNKNLKERAQQLRDNMTDAERQPWAKIRMNQLNGYRFYRQKPVGDYIVDFFCPKAKLIIEVDGSQHFDNETIEYDRLRGDYISSLGLKVLRFTNAEVLEHVEGVVERIEEEVGSKIPLNPPFSKGEEQPASPFCKGRKRGILTGIKGVR